jgi:hypothetical protein
MQELGGEGNWKKYVSYSASGSRKRSRITRFGLKQTKRCDQAMTKIKSSTNKRQTSSVVNEKALLLLNKHAEKSGGEIIPYPATGFFELFVKSTKYDNRWLIAQLNTGKTFDIAYRKYGLPGLLDGTTTLASPQDLHFWVPSQICGKSVAYVGSLVTY